MRKGIGLWLLLLSAVISCTEDLTVKNGQSNREIIFSAQLGISADVTRSAADVQTIQLTDGAQPLYLHRIVTPWGSTTQDITRGTMLNPTETNTTPIDFQFGVSGYTYNTTTGNTLTDRKANFFYNELVKRVGFELQWKTVDASYYWPTGGDKLAFYAYYPYQPEDADEVIKVYGDGSTTDDTAPMRIHYRVNSDITQQQDLMTAYATNQTFDQTTPVPLHFHHALTAIDLQLDNNVAPGLLKYVAFNNVFREGLLTVSGSDGTKPHGTWNFSGQAPETVTLMYASEDGTGGFDTEGTTRLLNNEPIFMLPQSFNNNNQTLYISINDSEDGNDVTGSHSLSVPLSKLGGWEAGTRVTYLINTNSINVVHMEGITYPASWGSDPFGVKTDYEAGDVVGVFAVNEDGKVVKANKPYRYNGTSWIGTNALDTLLYNPTTSYYLYYPYREDLKGARTVGSSFTTNPSAANVEDDFFSDVISQWTVSTDQSTKEKLLANDLQIAKATAGSKTLRVKATMKHVMGLSKLTLGYKKFTASVTYTAGGSSTGSPYTRSGQSVYVAATEELNNPAINPYLDTVDYYFITNGNQSITFNSVQGLFNTWASSVAVSTENGTYKTYTAYPNDNAGNYTFQGKFYNYINNTVQELDITKPGYYTLEVWGAQGGTVYTYTGGRGGYSIGAGALSSNSTIYIVVGGAGVGATAAGQTRTGGYNGGGTVTGYSGWNHITGSGGGATHIAKATGLLSSLSSNRDAVLIVAGGGGGSRDQQNFSGGSYNRVLGGCGGGISGGTPTVASGGRIPSTPDPGTQNSGYAFGQGLDNTGNSGGGGGWYGGNATGAGAGGSGYIGGVIDGNTIAGDGTTSFANTDANGTETAHTGDGYARIVIPIPVGQ